MRQILCVKDTWSDVKAFFAPFAVKHSLRVPISGPSAFQQGEEVLVHLQMQNWKIWPTPRFGTGKTYSFAEILHAIKHRAHVAQRDEIGASFVITCNEGKHITEISFVSKSGGVPDRSPNSRKGIAHSTRFSLLAFHRTNAAFRAAKKSYGIGLKAALSPTYLFDLLDYVDEKIDGPKAAEGNVNC